MRYDDGTEELYDMLNDPQQFDNLASDPEYASILVDLRSALAERLRSGNLVGATH